MNKICTSIEQSQKLIKLGLDPNTGDMFWDTLLSKKPECHVNNHSFADDFNELFPSYKENYDELNNKNGVKLKKVW